MHQEPIVARVNPELKKDLKIIAIQQNKSMNQILTDLISEYVKKHKK